MNYKNSHAYNYGYLSSQVNISIDNLETLLRMKLRSVPKSEIRKIVNELKSSYEVTKYNLKITE